MSRDQKSALETGAPVGWGTITPRIVTTDPKGLVGFLRKVFGASGEFETSRPSILKMGDSRIMVSESGPRTVAPAFLYVYVQDADATYHRALEAGARSLEAPSEVPYGDRRAMVEDPWGNLWQIATHLGGRSRTPDLASSPR